MLSAAKHLCNGNKSELMARSVTEWEDALMGLIDSALAGDIGFAEFERLYTQVFVDEEPDAGIDWNRYQFFEEIHDELEFTTETDQSVQQLSPGFKTWGDFLKWLRGRRDAYS